MPEERNFPSPGGVGRIWPRVGGCAGDLQYGFGDFPVGTICGCRDPLTPGPTPLGRLARPLMGGQGHIAKFGVHTVYSK